MTVSPTHVGPFVQESELKYTAVLQLTHAECAGMMIT